MQLAISRNLDLVEICGVNPLFDIFCVMFEQASFSMAMRAYANNVGFGVQFAFELHRHRYLAFPPNTGAS